MRVGRWILGATFAFLVLIAIALVRIALLDVNQYKGRIESAAFEATGRTLKLEGPLRLRLIPRPALRVEGASLANAAWGSQPEMLRVGEFAAEVELWPLLRGTLHVVRLDLSDVDLFLETDARGRRNWMLERSPKRAPAPAFESITGEPPAPAKATPLPMVDALVAKDLRVAYRDGTSGRIRRLALERADVASEGAGAPMRLALAGALDALRFEAKGSVGALDRLMATNESAPFPVDLELRLADALTATLRGSVREPLTGRGLDLALAADADEIGAVASAAGVALPIGGPLHAAATLTEPSPKRFELAGLSLRLGAGDVAGSGSLDLSGARPSLQADLTSEALDLRAPAPGRAGAPAGAVPAPGAAPPPADGHLFSRAPLPLGALRDADAAVRWKIARLVTRSATLGGVDLQATLRDAQLALQLAAAEFEGGSLRLDATLGAAEGSLVAKLDARNVDAARLLRDLGQPGLLERGPADLSAELRGAGDSAHALAASLGGSAVLQLRGGRLDRGIASAGGPVGAVLKPLLSDAQDLALDCVVARFDLARGVATSRVLLADTPRIAVTGDGNVDLGEERIALVLTPRAKRGGAGVPVQVSGALAKPTVRTDAVAAAATAVEAFGSRKLRERVAEIAPGLTAGAAPPPVLSCEDALAIARGARPPVRPAPPATPPRDERAVDALDRGLRKLFGR